MRYDNLHCALDGEARALLRVGELVESREGTTYELIGRSIALSRPQERVQTHHARKANIFAQIAETLWVLRGRSDIAFLAPYLPRAPKFSDDGAVWRAGYGPRLRRWPVAGEPTMHFDQLRLCAHLLNTEPNTRRAVVSLWNPALDLAVSSLDIPCNNTLQFLARDGRLHLFVSVRSNDLWWGYSGINTFCWSVLLEAMACWTGCRVGTLTTFIGSLHLYERHWTVATALTREHTNIENLYNRPPSGYHAARWTTPLDEMDGEINVVFTIVDLANAGRLDAASLTCNQLSDPFLYDCARMLIVYARLRAGDPGREVRELVGMVSSDDLRWAAYEYAERFYARRVAATATATPVPATDPDHDSDSDPDQE